MKNESFPFNNNALKGFRALICGASKGIGKSIARSMAKAGADVIICSRNKDALDELCEELMNIGANSAKSLALDLENIEVVESAISELLNEGAIQILINNASGPPGGPLLDVELSEFETAFKRHLHAAHTITRMLVPGMEESGIGRIVNIISTSVREPIDNIGLSNTLRGSMASWSKSLSRELPACITINNILPGFTDTSRLNSLAKSISEKTGKSIPDIQQNWMSQVPIGRLIDPQETALAATFLCLPSSGGIRGISLAVDGGRMRSI
ncbi:MAG: short-chain dehydrogenase [Euryarchaeota archaeon]|nr:short-chain dehydrogenase [Euryarchaeota archaeon]|tara:strand:- start:1269 stop:2075 length:807 start_codon:yes stop_codon:yes gene_type:complete